MNGLANIGPARAAFRAALFPRERLTPGEWAEKHRVLSTEESDEPGPYTFDRTPYWRGPCDAIATDIEELVCLKGAQVGWSELCRNVMGYWIDCDPGACLVLMPDQKAAEDFRFERLAPLMKYTPAIAQHVSTKRKDNTKHRIKLDTMSVFMAWAGSKTGVKSRPIRYLVNEEPDEFPPFSSTGGDPLAKAEKRLTVAQSKGRSRRLTGGTPTTRRGNVWKRWEQCTAKLHFWVPCPHCNGFQELHWKSVKWPDLKGSVPDRIKRAEKIKAENLAYFECEHCQKSIHDHHKPPMLMRGVWASEDQAVTRDGRIVGQPVTAKRVGYFLPSTYSPWVTFSQLAEEWLLAQGDVQQLCDFVNQRLAQPFEEQREKSEPDFIREKVQARTVNGWEKLAESPAPRIIPTWAQRLFATSDTQGNSEQDGHFWWTIRAWGYGYRSQLIDFGNAATKDELLQTCLQRGFQFGSQAVTPQYLLIDTGGPRWSEVYQLAQADGRIKPTKGASKSNLSVVTESPQNSHKIVLWNVDTEQAKDLLHRLIHDPDRAKWMPHNEINGDYAAQMCSEAKVFDPQKNREEWVEIVQNNNHLWDCEVLQVAAAWKFGMGIPAPPEQVVAQPQSEPTSNPLTAHRGRW